MIYPMNSPMNLLFIVPYGNPLIIPLQMIQSISQWTGLREKLEETPMIFMGKSMVAWCLTKLSIEISEKSPSIDFRSGTSTRTGAAARASPGLQRPEPGLACADARLFAGLAPKGCAWWLIPLSKWVITPVINGISRVNPLITGVITHLRFVGWATKWSPGH